MENFIQEQKFKEMLDAHLEDFNRLTREEHAAHHEFLQDFIERYEKHCKLCTDVQNAILIWGITAILGLFSYWILEHVSFFHYLPKLPL